MRLKISLAASLAAAFLLAAACGPQDGSAPAGSNGGAQKQPAANQTAAKPAAPTPAQAEDVRRISIAEARAEADAGRAVFYDVRTKQAYDAGHIKGAKLIPLDQVAERVSTLPKDKLIITYCA